MSTHLILTWTYMNHLVIIAMLTFLVGKLALLKAQEAIVWIKNGYEENVSRKCDLALSWFWNWIVDRILSMAV